MSEDQSDKLPADGVDEQGAGEQDSEETSRGVSPELSASQRVRRLTFAGGGVVVAVAAAVFGLRWLRGRRG
jgi:hypothetical protein